MYIMEYYGSNDWRDYHLAHHGVKGMHWGIRRFQPYSVTGPRKGGATGKLVGLAKKVASGTATGAKIAAKGARAGAYALASHRQKAKMRKEDKKREKLEKEKEEILKTGSAEKVLANKDKFSNDELEAFMTRAAKEQRVADLASKQNPTGWDKADDINAKAKKIVDYMVTANNLATQGLNMHKNIKEVSKILNDPDKDKKKIIESGDADLILKNRDKLSNDEIRAALGRARTEKSLRDMADKDRESIVNTYDNPIDPSIRNPDRPGGYGRQSDRVEFNNSAKGHTMTNNDDFKSESVNNYGPANNAGKTNNLFGGKSFNGREDNSFAEGQASQIKKQMGRNFEDNNNFQSLKPKALPGPKSSDGGNSGNDSPKSPLGGNSPKSLPAPKGGVRDVPDTAKKAAKSSSMSEGIKLTLNPDSVASNENVRNAAKKFSDMAQKHMKSFKQTKKDRDLADATMEELLRRMNSGEG